VSALALALDALLALAIPAVGLAAVLRRDLFQSVMLLFSLGVLLALAWARLGAPDVAMVEAATKASATRAAAASRRRAAARRTSTSCGAT
jgi:uncharacterized MnhB-related membrane protein